MSLHRRAFDSFCLAYIHVHFQSFIRGSGHFGSLLTRSLLLLLHSFSSSVAKEIVFFVHYSWPVCQETDGTD